MMENVEEKNDINATIHNNSIVIKSPSKAALQCSRATS